jgi:hypothetical protein
MMPPADQATRANSSGQGGTTVTCELVQESLFTPSGVTIRQSTSLTF